MIEYNEVMLTAILGLSASVYAIMEAVGKPFLKRVIAWVETQKWIPILNGIDPKERGKKLTKTVYPIVWRVLGVLLGIGAVALSGNGNVSFLKMWNIYLADLPDWVDILVTGVVVGLGDRGIHWLVDWIEANGISIANWLEKAGKVVPGQT
jgi:hypothetical protein